MNYTRKRALLACDFCRHRKRRCDGQTPCSTCKDSNANCVYKELPYDRIEDASPTAVVDRLARIEALLEQQSQQLRHLSTHSTPTTVSAAPFDYFPSPIFGQASGFVEPSPVTLDDTSSESSSFLIPKGHTTVASTLLSVPKVRDLLGEYPRDFFYNIEERHPLPDPLKGLDARKGWPLLRQDALDKLAENYFRRVHPHHPLFSAYTFRQWQTKLLKKEPLKDVEAAICLCVYALGCVTSTLASSSDSSDEALGMNYFKPALGIILHQYTWNFRPNLAICQALLLAGSYFSHLGRPLHCWRMAFFASQRFLHYLDFQRSQIPYPECSEAELRVFWQCFLDDCNRAADLDVPRSGIEPLGDKMPLPHSLDPSDHEETIHFIAEIAIRRLLNRIHSSLYSPEHTDTTSAIDPAISWQGLSLQKLLALSSELDRQLEEWYISIPDGIRPPRGVEHILSDRGRVLRIRYYAARHIVHRPFVLHAVVQQQQAVSRPASPGDPSDLSTLLPQIVIDNCEVCIESCTMYLHNAGEMLEKRSPYLWSFSQSCMACLIVLMIAESCPPLRKFVPDMRPLQSMVISRVKRWAVKGSSFEAEVAILENLVFDDSRNP
ncbi:fungal-specific transcription factor domain-containing protein [Xylariales sp. AK1849]|nr:fungal-specific transcription factor domain-containing protein [Xylariales sp. AK1849]